MRCLEHHRFPILNGFVYILPLGLSCYHLRSSTTVLLAWPMGWPEQRPSLHQPKRSIGDDVDVAPELIVFLQQPRMIKPRRSPHCVAKYGPNWLECIPGHPSEQRAMDVS